MLNTPMLTIMAGSILNKQYPVIASQLQIVFEEFWRLLFRNSTKDDF